MGISRRNGRKGSAGSDAPCSALFDNKTEEPGLNPNLRMDSGSSVVVDRGVNWHEIVKR